MSEFPEADEVKKVLKFNVLHIKIQFSHYACLTHLKHYGASTLLFYSSCQKFKHSENIFKLDDQAIKVHKETKKAERIRLRTSLDAECGGLLALSTGQTE